MRKVITIKFTKSELKTIIMAIENWDTYSEEPIYRDLAKELKRELEKVNE